VHSVVHFLASLEQHWVNGFSSCMGKGMHWWSATKPLTHGCHNWQFGGSLADRDCCPLVPPVGAHGVTVYMYRYIDTYVCICWIYHRIPWMHVRRIRKCALCDVCLTGCLVAWNFVQSLAVIKLKTYLAPQLAILKSIVWQ